MYEQYPPPPPKKNTTFWGTTANQPILSICDFCPSFLCTWRTVQYNTSWVWLKWILGPTGVTNGQRGGSSGTKMRMDIWALLVTPFFFTVAYIEPYHVYQRSYVLIHTCQKREKYVPLCYTYIVVVQRKEDLKTSLSRQVDFDWLCYK